MTTFTPVASPVTPRDDEQRRLDPSAAAATGVLALILIGLAFVIPDRTSGGAAMPGMAMTHYMELLSVNQPWNLLLFMAGPVILAETLAITELVILFRHPAPAWVHRLSRIAGLLAGPLMLAIAIHLLRYAVTPLTANGGWRGPADLIAVLAYLLGAAPLVAITLIEIGVIGRTQREARKWHATMVGVFLVVAHVAMIAGMLDPGVLRWADPGAGVPQPAHVMPNGEVMPGIMPGTNP